LHPLPFSGGPLFAIIFWGVYVTWMALEINGAKNKPAKDRSQNRDRGSYQRILRVFCLALASAFALAFLFPQATIVWHRVPVFFVGIVLMLAGIAFRFYAMWVLGKFFTYQVAVHSGQVVVQAGPYRYSRHPSYTGALITLAGLGLALG